MAKRSTSDGMMVRPSIAYERPKPTISVDEKDLPQIKSWDVGKKYKLEIKVEMVSHAKGEYAIAGEKKRHEARLKVISFKESGKN